MAKKKINRLLPLIPLRNMVVFPKMIIPLFVGRQKSIQALEESLSNDRMVILVSQRNENINEPAPQELNAIGTLVEIVQMLKLPDGTIKVLAEGVSRVRITELVEADSFFKAKAEIIEDVSDITNAEYVIKSISEQFEHYVKLNNKIPAETLMSIISIEDPSRLADLITSYLVIDVNQKQDILEINNVAERLGKLSDILLREIDLLEVEKKLHVKVQDQIEKVQREYYLKEKIKAIKEELGDYDEIYSEVDDYKKKITTLSLPPEAKSKVTREISRLDKIPTVSSESGVIRTYLDWLLELPWNTKTEDYIDIDKVKEILDNEHYGLDKVKERILEYFAVFKLTKRIQGTILCLVGPPGVGKTSIANSIANAMNRKFCRISLGGIKDEAELRGHRRTYVGSLPGRIIQAIHRAKTKNPVILLDEIDKLGTEFRGDPAAALMEILDPEQNSTFSDHYLEVPFDLSNVMFIATANTTHTIEKPLLDRMEVIPISGYTDAEKKIISNKHLIPKQLEKNGIPFNDLIFTDQGISMIIKYYTREAGIRNLERLIALFCRKAAKNIITNDKLPIETTKATVKKFLGPVIYRGDKMNEEHEIGVATGLAWTAVGGCLIPIEVASVKGRGKLMLTGQMGDVMQESAQAALTYIRSCTHRLGIDDDFHRKRDIHIHIPEGAVPKDGPSAGITIACALASSLSGIPVRKDVAMTGEITLRGKVLPIGGLKEKVLAAFQAGIHIVIIPADNEPNLADIPKYIRRKMKFVKAKMLDEVLATAFTQMPNKLI
ncbi:MAG: endopeptidase La [Candidatus Margulisiibacteriota bacterium]|nr:MAG: endopeptidase La [Candidatus Margulisbacteria bacterium GWD2_39_127]OGI02190.1 MAG: endopeptidase La [Candidatus Margulisbacteria bacterium GWF2_38_17]OGI09028.1 MAG: endopeptidase La [Candidatus Margulisbacteria bacterium GWE2_39_32]PZM84997.1 MAG: endopeptidase La [Candidatus Margulisiibacteriota bacterium]HAR63183.1 endopeptidase La [Candidatus Margulisiibacteriota bacterium]